MTRFVALLLLAFATLPAHAADDAVVDVAYGDRSRLQALAARFQHLDVDGKRATARTIASPDEIAALRGDGYLVSHDYVRTAGLHAADAAVRDKSIGGYECYRTVEETYAAMDAIVAAHPTLARIVDIGPTWERTRNPEAGYTMKVLVLGNTATDAALPDKPNMVVVSAIHAREYATAELMTRFAEELVQEHGLLDEATFLLDNFRFHLVLQSNPDGRKLAERGLFWRKNTNTTNGVCTGTSGVSHAGTDLNRNFPFRWGGSAEGSSTGPCDQTYRGPTEASEPETQALLRYVAGTRGSDGVYRGGVLPDRVVDGGLAPDDYQGLFIDVHSFANLVMWPWGDTDAPAPNGDALRTLGRRMAFYTGYRPQQSNELFITNGTTKDATYGLLGVPSYTVELALDSFFQDCGTFEFDVAPTNREALRYAARTLPAPYRLAGGPVTRSVVVDRTAVAGAQIGVSAVVDDVLFSQANGIEPTQAIVSASAYVDVAPWRAGAVAVPLVAADGAFDTPSELAQGTIDTRGLAPGMHTVFVQARDASGALGAAHAGRFEIVAPATGVQSGWYWNQAEPGRGVFIERNAAGRVFTATFHYAPDGRATWFSGEGPFAAGAFTSPMYMFSGGQTLAGAWRAPTATAPTGDASLLFTTPTEGQLVWPAGSVPLTRFPFTQFGQVLPPPDGAPESGWWWNPAEPGRGFAIEIQGGFLFLAAFMYADDGTPTWYVSNGPMATPTSFAGNVDSFRDGQAPGGPHRAPVRATEGATLILFDGPRNGRVWLPDGRVIPIERFEF